MMRYPMVWWCVVMSCLSAAATTVTTTLSGPPETTCTATPRRRRKGLINCELGITNYEFDGGAAMSDATGGTIGRAPDVAELEMLRRVEADARFMRDRQRAYFDSGRNARTLAESKRAEQALDYVLGIWHEWVGENWEHGPEGAPVAPAAPDMVVAVLRQVACLATHVRDLQVKCWTTGARTGSTLMRQAMDYERRLDKALADVRRAERSVGEL